MEQLGHFRILDRIGAGGMGEVYLARDEKLQREVAVKLLPANALGDTNARARLLREARSAAALNHPNICVVHEVGEADGQAYIAMEHIEGMPLSRLLAEGPLPLTDVIRYGIQLADALEHAHERHIVHRDLKPGNVILMPAQRLKVLDFGLARRLSDENSPGATTAVQLTQPGAVMGTPAYMSPEQLRGLPADTRSDIWALGVMLYEMAAGAPPFDGQTWPELSASVLTQPPKPLPDAMPRELHELILRCLEKTPSARYQRASEVRAVLETIQSTVTSARSAQPRPDRTRRIVALTAALTLIVTLVAIATGRRWFRPDEAAPAISSPASITSIAVLPLANLSGDPSQQYLADGVHSGLIGELAKVTSLRVISRTSVQQYRENTRPLSEIARELNVRGIVEGGVMRTGDRLRLQVRLLDARGGERSLFVSDFERPLGQVLSLYADVARGVARHAGVAISAGEEQRLSGSRELRPELYELYIRAVHHLDKMTPEGFEEGLKYLQQAVDLDPGDPLPYAGLALAYSKIAHGPGDPRQDFPRAKAAAERALRLDPGLAEARQALAQIKLYWDWDLNEAGEALRQVIEWDPSIAAAHADYAWWLVLARRYGDAVQSMERAQQVDPLDPLWPAWAAWIHLWRPNLPGETDRQRQDLGLKEAAKALTLKPDYVLAWYLIGALKAQQGGTDEALDYAGRLRNGPFGWGAAHIHAILGRPDEARRIASEVARRPSPLDVWGLAEVYGTIGDNETALQWLERAVAEKWSYVPWVLETPSFQALRGELRFQAIVRELGVPLRPKP